MLTVNMRDAKAQFSSLVDAVESGTESEIIIAAEASPGQARSSRSAKAD